MTMTSPSSRCTGSEKICCSVVFAVQVVGAELGGLDPTASRPLFLFATDPMGLRFALS